MKPPFWAEAVLRWQLDPREEEMIVGDFREEFFDAASRLGPLRATFRYCSQVASFLREGGAERILGITSFGSLYRAALLWLIVFAIAGFNGLRMQPFTPVPGVIACLAIVPLAALDIARRSGYARAGVIFGVALGAAMFLLGATIVKSLHLPSPPLSVVPVLPAITIVAFAAVGAAIGRRFRNLGRLEY